MAQLRSLPSVEQLASRLEAPHALAIAAAREAIDDRRAELRSGSPGDADLLARARAALAAMQRPSLGRVVNATGVVLHTNLGRAPLAEAARRAVEGVAGAYSNLELDLAEGRRGSRQAHVESLLVELTGAEAALAVNNCAAAVLLAAAALAGDGRALLVSRGQLVEIGGSFRIPEVVAQSGARLVEVGTTNRTRLDDYEAAIGDDTAAILRVHQSNFRTVGFAEEVEIEALCRLGPAGIDDIGSGALAAGVAALRDEPPVRRSVLAGAALVCFSGDKLLGGPQAGLVVGRADALERARSHPPAGTRCRRACAPATRRSTAASTTAGCCPTRAPCATRRSRRPPPRWGRRWTPARVVERDPQGGAVPPLTLGTAGHIDHGKTALIAALTGVDADRLPQERARGISIELGYARLRLPSGRSVSVVDVPGHERFVRTMVAGATGVDMYLMTVAADDGVMPQTRE